MSGVSEQLAALPRMSKLELQKLWNNCFRRSPHCQMRRELMIQILAHEIQKQEYGGLSDPARRRIRNLSRAGRNAFTASALRGSFLKPGTRLIREWKNQAHVVTVAERGFEYQGSRYDSLSEIARTITGTRWSGPLFFGLKDKKAPSVENPREC